MKAEELENLPWRHLTWEEWQKCLRSNPGVDIVFRWQIDEFVESLVQEICVDANMHYHEVKMAFVNKNTVFYELKNNLFTRNTSFCQVWKTLMMDVLRQLLEVPDFQKWTKGKEGEVLKENVEISKNETSI